MNTMFSTAAKQAMRLSTKTLRTAATAAGSSPAAKPGYFLVGATAVAASAYLTSDVEAARCETKVKIEPTGAVSVTVDSTPASASKLLSVLSYSDELAKIAKTKATMPDNIAIQKFDFDYFATLTPDQQGRLLQCIKTGWENPDSGLGCYAMAPADYDEFAPYFDAVCQEYHKAGADAVHTTDWDASAVGEGGVLDVTKLGLSELSMRVRVGRNLTKFNLPGAMDKAERIEFEKAMLKAFEKLTSDPAYGGKVYSLSPDFGAGVANPNLISPEKYNELVKAHVMFKDMDADPYLKSAGIASDWPYGRGCWQSDDKQCIVWFGEEDQLRIMCMKKGTKLNEVFDRLKKMLDTIESIDGIDFAVSSKYGYVTSCPSNLGTGMRASVHVKIPNLTADGTETAAKKVCKPIGLSVRGTGGEHTPIGADGTVDISPSSRLFIKERDIIAKLYSGVQELMVEEKKAPPRR